MKIRHYTIERDRHCWTLHEDKPTTIKSGTRKGQPGTTRYSTYYATLEQVLDQILDREAGKCKEAWDLRDHLMACKNEILKALCAGIAKPRKVA